MQHLVTRNCTAMTTVLVSEQAWDFSQEVIRKTLHMLGYPRDKNMHMHGGAVASDEMRFYLHSPQHCGKVIVVPPMILTDLDDAILLAEAWQVEFHLTSPVPLVSAVLFNGHWIRVIAVPCDWQLHWASNLEGIQAWALMFPFDKLPTQIQQELPSVFVQDCGFQEFAWIKSLVTASVPQSMTTKEASQWRHLFWQQLFVEKPMQRTEWVSLGGQSELETAIAAILREHGVFPERVVERAKQVIQQLGTTPVTNAIHAARPWASLGKLANSQTPRLRLIWEDEFSKIAQSQTA